MTQPTTPSPATTPREQKTHVLRCYPAEFQAIVDGTKPFDCRRADRDFQENDVLDLREFEPLTEQYTGRAISRSISYVMPGGQFGIMRDFFVLGLDARDFVYAGRYGQIGLVRANSAPYSVTCLHMGNRFECFNKNRGFVRIKHHVQHTSEYFEGKKSIAGRALQVIERDKEGNCLCIVSGTRHDYLVDVHRIDMESRPFGPEIPPFDMGEKVRPLESESLGIQDAAAQGLDQEFFVCSCELSAHMKSYFWNSQREQVQWVLRLRDVHGLKFTCAAESVRAVPLA